jgi:hypothetical protein
MNIVYKGPKTRIVHQVTLALTYIRGLHANLPRISDQADRRVRTPLTSNNFFLTDEQDLLAHSRQQCATAKTSHVRSTSNLTNQALRWHILQEVEAHHLLPHLLIHIIFLEQRAKTNWRCRRVCGYSTRPTNTTNQGQRHLRKNNNPLLDRKINALRYTTHSRMQSPCRMDHQHQQLQHLYKCLT